MTIKQNVKPVGLIWKQIIITFSFRIYEKKKVAEFSEQISRLVSLAVGAYWNRWSCKRDHMDSWRVTPPKRVPHLPGVPHLHVNRPLVWFECMAWKQERFLLY